MSPPTLTASSTNSSKQSFIHVNSGVMLQPFNLKSNDVVSNCSRCPTFLGNPESLLPFLSAQANTLFSMAGEGTSGPSNLPPSSACKDNDKEASESDFPVGLDLGNGWKVVGLTSLADIPSQSSSQHHSAVTSENNSGSATGCNQVACDLNKNAPSVNANNNTLLSSSDSSQWKVVGVTSLNAGHSSDTAPTHGMGSLNAVSLSSDVTSQVVNYSKSDQNQLSDSACRANGMQNELKLPSLADLAAGTSDWKIAGLTTLFMPFGTTKNNENEKGPITGCDNVSIPPGSIGDLTDSKAADPAKWKVVGVTSMNTPSSDLSAAVSSVNPIPVVMASVPPLISLPALPAAGEAEWKVVGVVPLPHNGGETLPDTDRPASQTCCNEQFGNMLAKPLSQDEVDTGTVILQPPVHKNFVSDPARACQASKGLLSSRITHGRKWASELLQQQRKDHGHPLAFLRNCSSHFKNTVLKKNTVSTMLELKRTFQNFTKEEKWVNFLERKNRLSLRKHGHQSTVFSSRNQFSKSKYVHQVDYKRKHSVAQHSPLTESSKQIFHHNESALSMETDDKAALSKAYRVQRESSHHDQGSGIRGGYFNFAHVQTSSHTNDQGNAPAGSQAFHSHDCLQVIKSEDGHAMTISGFDSHDVNLTNVDPWGVCTDEDLGRIAEMMSDRGENRIHHSSSRKRKLTTPRKMVQ